MTITGIIAEYNPFHLGHAYHLNKARELTHADYLVVVMSGDFVQRGEPAIADKYLRARMALENGADLVIELPVLFSTAGGEDFARGSVALLDRLGVVDHLCFGSESGNLSELISAAENLDCLSPETESNIRSALKEGLSYPAAVARALSGSDEADSSDADLISSPNNLLGIEYCRALKQFSSRIRPMTISRLGGYHDSLPDDANKTHIDSETTTFASASALRAYFSDLSVSDALQQIRTYIPESVSCLLNDAANVSFPMTADDFSGALFLRLLEHSSESLSEVSDISDALADRILNTLPGAHSFSNLAETVKCKSYTRLRINRALIHCLLGITSGTLRNVKASGYAHYGRILGFRETARPLLKELSEHAKIPLIYQPAHAKEMLSREGKPSFSLDVFAAELYRMTAQRKFGSVIPEEYRRKLITI